MHNPQTIYFSDFVQTWFSLCFDMQWSDSKCTTSLVCMWVWLLPSLFDFPSCSGIHCHYAEGPALLLQSRRAQRT